MPELQKSEVSLLRELQGDLEHLRRKAKKLIDKTYLTQDKIQKIKWRLRSYPLPDGRTR